MKNLSKPSEQFIRGLIDLDKLSSGLRAPSSHQAVFEFKSWLNKCGEVLLNHVGSFGCYQNMLADSAL